jgi:hypothetical protein
MCPSNEVPVITALSRQERILLWTIRAWVIGITRKIPVEERIQDAFNRIGAPDATGQLYAFMWVLSHGASRALNVDCVCHGHVSTDERALLDIMALTQAGRSFEALVTLRSMVGRDTAIAAADSAARIMRAFSAAGFVLPVRTLETARYILPRSTESTGYFH